MPEMTGQTCQILPWVFVCDSNMHLHRSHQSNPRVTPSASGGLRCHYHRLHLEVAQWPVRTAVSRAAERR